MAFPSSPANNQVAVQNGITYTYNSTYKSWTRNPATLPTLSVYTDTFTGDGVTTSFSLSLTPGSADFISINIDGVSQLKSAYTLSTNIVTFTGIPDVGAVIEVKSWNSATVGVLTGLTFDSFTGNGTGTTYTLSTTPTNKNYTLVTVGGITQEKVNYSVSGTTLTFTTAPPNTAPIEVMTFGPAVNSYSGAIAIQNSGSNLTTTANTINFTGSGVTATNSGNVVTVTVSGSSGSSLAVQLQGTNVATTANTINFVGGGDSVTASGNVVTVNQLSPFLLMGA